MEKDITEPARLLYPLIDDFKGVKSVAEYYLDIETTGLDPKKDQIITIQYQRLGMLTGRSEGDLNILRSWESSEKEILSGQN